MSLIEKHTVTWCRNTVKGMQSDSDKAESFEEACEIAEARVRGGGIPASANVTDSTGTSRRRYTKDFDGRTSYVDGAPK